MKTKLHYVLTIAMLLFVFSSFGQKNFFEKVSSENKSFKNSKTSIHGITYEFNYKELSEKLLLAKKNNSKKISPKIVIGFPNIDGELINYEVFEASVMHPDLQAKYPEIRSYAGYALDKSSSVIRFSLSPYKGLTGIILGKEKTIVYNPIPKNPNQLSVQYKSDLIKADGFECKTLNSFYEKSSKSSSIKDADDSQKRTYRLALSVTGEYSAFHGGTLASVNAAIVATLTNVNAVFENDLNANMELVANNDAVIYLNPSTDPYSNSSNYNSEVQSTLDAVIMNLNYDVGHLLAASEFGGDAGCIGCICNSGNKGSAYTSDTEPDGFNFDIDLVAHELGHQFGANHTWTHGGNEGENVQMEAGSGSTVMGYAGITGSTNVQLHSDPYFHAISIQQITTVIKNTSCAAITNTGNTTPTVSAGSNLVLPIGTAFKLVGSGNDVDGDIITYCWEQIDEDDAATTYPNPSSTNSNSVLFRSFPPTISNTRYFPNLADLKFGINATQWEKIPNVNRTADFRLTVRDNKPGGANNSHDDMLVTFDSNYGPFEITSQNTSGILWTSGTTETITWNVNNTNNLVGASNVNILLSTDGGETYTNIVSNIPNNGSYTLTVPNTPAPYCRIMIEPTNNNFFAINSEDFAIDYNITTTCTQYNSPSGLGISITDNAGNFTQSHIINVTDATTITDVNIGVNISHTYIGDLAVAVLSPNGTGVLLKSPSDCDSEEDLLGIFDDQAITYNCLNSSANIASKSLNDLLSSLNGENASGNWTIQVGDFEAGDNGTLNSWFVEICETTETLLNTDGHEISNFKLYPNPNKGEFTIKLNNSLSNEISVEVFDLRGRNIFYNTYNNADDFNETIRLTNIQTGMYILNVTDGSRNYLRKIIIE
ncbi:reprolysin-like metallopeptidase [Litoribaculum gwangyangense]|uniref:P/Homo B domain-containing protein n=1 Tax=Litoribaculum gwangyangense TaxID=1130722 RepID=A0ABP9BVN2_9FLAO